MWFVYTHAVLVLLSMKFQRECILVSSCWAFCLTQTLMKIESVIKGLRRWQDQVPLWSILTRWSILMMYEKMSLASGTTVDHIWYTTLYWNRCPANFSLRKQAKIMKTPSHCAGSTANTHPTLIFNAFWYLLQVCIYILNWLLLLWINVLVYYYVINNTSRV